MDLKVVVTGALSGIGQAAAARFAKDGQDVFITGPSEFKLEETVSLAKEQDEYAEAVCCASDCEKRVKIQLRLQYQTCTYEAFVDCDRSIVGVDNDDKTGVDVWTYICPYTDTSRYQTQATLCRPQCGRTVNLAVARPTRLAEEALAAWNSVRLDTNSVDSASLKLLLVHLVQLNLRLYNENAGYIAHLQICRISFLRIFFHLYLFLCRTHLLYCLTVCDPIKTVFQSVKPS